MEFKLENEKGKRFESSSSNIKLKPVRLFCPGCCFVSPVLKLSPRTPCMPGEHSSLSYACMLFIFNLPLIDSSCCDLRQERWIQVEVLAALAEEPGTAPSTCTAAHNCPSI